MKKIRIGMFCVALCMAVTFIFPCVGRTYIDAYDASEWELLDDFLTHPPDGLVDDALCLTCHDAGGPGDDPPTLHGIHGSGAAGCMDCHTDSTALGTVFASSCVVCHPSGDEGTCQLVDLHDPGYGADCLGCHTECVEETTTTTTAEETTTTTTADVTTTTTTADVTTTTTTADVTSTTTTARTDRKCCLLKIYGEDSDEIAIMRYIRDNVLSKSEEGREIIKTYYRLSPAIARAMRRDKELKAEIKEMVDGILEATLENAE